MKVRIVKGLFALALIASLIFSGGCGGKQESTQGQPPVTGKDWAAIVAQAKGSTVYFYGWGGDQRINRWLDETVAPGLREKYGIKLVRVGMNINEILTKLISEKQAGRESGSIDIVWINGENFYTAKKNDLLHGPFAQDLQAVKQYIDGRDPESQFDFGQPIEGYEAPFGKAQLVVIYDSAKIKEDELPRSAQALMALAQKYPGKITYPAPPDFTGSAFVRNVICDVVGRDKLDNLNPRDKAAVEAAVRPGMEFLAGLKPYLWRKGETYPATLAQLHNMFADGEIILAMDYAPYSAMGKVRDGQFPSTVKTLVFDKGTLGNTHYLAVPFNSPNKAGAMVAINFLLSPEMQASKYAAENWGDLPAIDMHKLSAEEQSLFGKANRGDAAISGEYLQGHRISEPYAALVPVIDEIWLQRVVREGK